MVQPGVHKDRIPSRHEKNRNPTMDGQDYYVGGRNKSSGNQGNLSSAKGKQNIVEVLEFESEVQSPNDNHFYSKNNQSVRTGGYSNQAALF